MTSPDAAPQDPSEVIQGAKAQIEAIAQAEDLLVAQRYTDRLLDTKADLAAEQDPEIQRLKREVKVLQQLRDVRAHFETLERQEAEQRERERRTQREYPYGLQLPPERNTSDIVQKIRAARQSKDKDGEEMAGRDADIRLELKRAREDTLQLASVVGSVLVGEGKNPTAKIFYRSTHTRKRLFGTVEETTTRETNAGWWLDIPSQNMNWGSRLMLDDNGDLVSTVGGQEDPAALDSRLQAQGHRRDLTTSKLVCKEHSISIVNADHYGSDLGAPEVSKDNVLGTAHVVLRREMAVQDALLAKLEDYSLSLPD